jgi:hypothetical protein
MYIISRANDSNIENQDPSNHEIDPDQYHYFSSFNEALISSYLTALGDWGTDDFDDSGNGQLTWTIFLLATALNCVVMLNLLIAIVSETFANVLAEKDENSY